MRENISGIKKYKQGIKLIFLDHNTSEVLEKKKP